jgi:hypothetical protein
VPSRYGKIDVGLDVTPDAGIAVPVPGTAEVRGDVEDPDVRDSGAGEGDRGLQPPDPRPDDEHVHLLRDRLAGDRRPGVRVGVQMGVGTLQKLELVRPRRAEPLVALAAVPLPDGVDVAHGPRARGREAGVFRLVRGRVAVLVDHVGLLAASGCG